MRLLFYNTARVMLFSILWRTQACPGIGLRAHFNPINKDCIMCFPLCGGRRLVLAESIGATSSVQPLPYW